MRSQGGGGFSFITDGSFPLGSLFVCQNRKNCWNWMYLIVLMLKNCIKSEKINSVSSSKVNIIKINQTKTRFNLNRWKLIYHQWMNISCDGRTKKFYSLEIDNVHLLRIVYFLCILHRLFLLGTFFGLLFVLGTLFLIRTGERLLRV